MNKILKLFLILTMLVFSILVLFEKKYDYISFNTYIDGLNNIKEEYDITSNILRFL